MCFLIDTPCFGFISFFAGKRSVLPQVPFCHSFHLPCIQIVKMEGVQPLDEHVGNAPGRRFLRNKLLLVSSVIQGLGLLLCLTYICLRFSAQVRCTTGMSFPPAQADGSSNSCKWSLGNNLTPKFFFFFPFLLSNRKSVVKHPFVSVFLPFFQQWQWWGTVEIGQGHCFWIILFLCNARILVFLYELSLRSFESLIYLLGLPVLLVSI